MHNLFSHDSKIAALAAGRVQDKVHQLGQTAQGDITFTGQPSAGDKITINGVEFAFVASGATGNQINISGVNLSGTIDNIVTKLNASVDAAVSPATYSNVGGTKLRAIYDAAGVAGNAFTLGETSSAASCPATLSGGVDTDAASIKLDAETIALITAPGPASAMALPAGYEGQEVTLYLKTKGTGSNAVVSGAFVGGTALTFDTAGKMAKLKYLNASWAPIANTGSIA